MNPLKSLINHNNGNANFLRKIMGAMLSGQSPEDFLRSQAGNFPQLKGIDFSDLEGSARKIANDQGKDINDVIDKAKGLINQ